jgi:transcriptional regulator with XRE-family HTH domain
MLHIHEKIERARVSKGLTQEELADKIGIARTTYKGYEEKTPTIIEKIVRVARALELPDNYFFVNDGEESVLTPDQKYVLTLEALNDAYKKEIDRLRDDLDRMKGKD